MTLVPRGTKKLASLESAATSSVTPSATPSPGLPSSSSKRRRKANHLNRGNRQSLETRLAYFSQSDKGDSSSSSSKRSPSQHSNVDQRQSRKQRNTTDTFRFESPSNSYISTSLERKQRKSSTSSSSAAKRFCSTVLDSSALCSSATPAELPSSPPNDQDNYGGRSKRFLLSPRPVEESVLETSAVSAENSGYPSLTPSAKETFSSCALPSRVPKANRKKKCRPSTAESFSNKPLLIVNASSSSLTAKRPSSLCRVPSSSSSAAAGTSRKLAGTETFEDQNTSCLVKPVLQRSILSPSPIEVQNFLSSSLSPSSTSSSNTTTSLSAARSTSSSPSWPRSHTKKQSRYSKGHEVKRTSSLVCSNVCTEIEKRRRLSRKLLKSRRLGKTNLSKESSCTSPRIPQSHYNHQRSLVSINNLSSSVSSRSSVSSESMASNQSKEFKQSLSSTGSTKLPASNNSRQRKKPNKCRRRFHLDKTGGGASASQCFDWRRTTRDVGRHSDDLSDLQQHYTVNVAAQSAAETSPKLTKTTSSVNQANDSMLPCNKVLEQRKRVNSLRGAARANEALGNAFLDDPQQSSMPSCAALLTEQEKPRNLCATFHDAESSANRLSQSSRTSTLFALEDLFAAAWHDSSRGGSEGCSASSTAVRPPNAEDHAVHDQTVSKEQSASFSDEQNNAKKQTCFGANPPLQQYSNSRLSDSAASSSSSSSSSQELLEKSSHRSFPNVLFSDYQSSRNDDVGHQWSLILTAMESSRPKEQTLALQHLHQWLSFVSEDMLTVFPLQRAIVALLDILAGRPSTRQQTRVLGNRRLSKDQENQTSNQDEDCQSEPGQPSKADCEASGLDTVRHGLNASPNDTGNPPEEANSPTNAFFSQLAAAAVVPSNQVATDSNLERTASTLSMSERNNTTAQDSEGEDLEEHGDEEVGDGHRDAESDEPFFFREEESIPLESFVDNMGDCSSYEESELEMVTRKISAANCLHLILDVSSKAASFIAEETDGLTVLCNELTQMSYVDLAERIVVVLQTLSAEVPRHVLRAGGVTALLNFMDFSSFRIQRSVVRAIICLLTQLNTVDDFQHYVYKSLPQLVSLMSRNDSQIVQAACQCIQLVTDFVTSSKVLRNSPLSVAAVASMVDAGVVLQLTETLLQCIVLSDPTPAAHTNNGVGALTEGVSMNRYTLAVDILHTLAAFAFFSDVAAKMLLEKHIFLILCHFLSWTDTGSGVPVDGGYLTVRVLEVAVSLLPSVHICCPVAEVSSHLVNVDPDRSALFTAFSDEQSKIDEHPLKFIYKTFLPFLVRPYLSVPNSEAFCLLLAFLTSFTTLICLDAEQHENGVGASMVQCFSESPELIWHLIAFLSGCVAGAPLLVQKRTLSSLNLHCYLPTYPDFRMSISSTLHVLLITSNLLRAVPFRAVVACQRHGFDRMAQQLLLSDKALKKQVRQENFDSSVVEKMLWNSVQLHLNNDATSTSIVGHFDNNIPQRHAKANHYVSVNVSLLCRWNAARILTLIREPGTSNATLLTEALQRTVQALSKRRSRFVLQQLRWVKQTLLTRDYGNELTPFDVYHSGFLLELERYLFGNTGPLNCTQAQMNPWHRNIFWRALLLNSKAASVDEGVPIDLRPLLLLARLAVSSLCFVESFPLRLLTQLNSACLDWPGRAKGEYWSLVNRYLRLPFSTKQFSGHDRRTARHSKDKQPLVMVNPRSFFERLYRDVKVNVCFTSNTLDSNESSSNPNTNAADDQCRTVSKSFQADRCALLWSKTLFRVQEAAQEAVNRSTLDCTGTNDVVTSFMQLFLDVSLPCLAWLDTTKTCGVKSVSVKGKEDDDEVQLDVDLKTSMTSIQSAVENALNDQPSLLYVLRDSIETFSSSSPTLTVPSSSPSPSLDDKAIFTTPPNGDAGSGAAASAPAEHRTVSILVGENVSVPPQMPIFEALCRYQNAVVAATPTSGRRRRAHAASSSSSLVSPSVIFPQSVPAISKDLYLHFPEDLRLLPVPSDSELDYRRSTTRRLSAPSFGNKPVVKGYTPLWGVVHDIQARVLSKLTQTVPKKLTLEELQAFESKCRSLAPYYITVPSQPQLPQKIFVHRIESDAMSNEVLQAGRNEVVNLLPTETFFDAVLSGDHSLVIVNEPFSLSSEGRFFFAGKDDLIAYVDPNNNLHISLGHLCAALQLANFFYTFFGISAIPLPWMFGGNSSTYCGSLHKFFDYNESICHSPIERLPAAIRYRDLKCLTPAENPVVWDLETQALTTQPELFTHCVNSVLLTSAKTISSCSQPPSHHASVRRHEDVYLPRKSAHGAVSSNANIPVCRSKKLNTSLDPLLINATAHYESSGVSKKAKALLRLIGALHHLMRDAVARNTELRTALPALFLTDVATSSTAYEPLYFPSDAQIEFAFCSSLLTAKIIRQLADPVVIASALVPSWISLITSVVPFLLPFDVRKAVFASVAPSGGVLRCLAFLRERLKHVADALGFLPRSLPETATRYFKPTLALLPALPSFTRLDPLWNSSNVSEDDAQGPSPPIGAGSATDPAFVVLAATLYGTNHVTATKRKQQERLADLEQALTPQRTKIRLSRARLLSSAFKALDYIHALAGTCSVPNTMEIEYFSEEGVGTGPTLEFYSEVLEHLVGRPPTDKTPPSSEKVGIRLFSAERPSGFLVIQPYKVDASNIAPSWFHRPSKTIASRSFTDTASASLHDVFRELNENDSCIEAQLFCYFKLLGQLYAKALLDRRLVDIPLHPHIWSMFRSPACDWLSLATESTFQQMRPELYRGLTQLRKLRDQGDDLEALSIAQVVPGVVPEIPLTDDSADIVTAVSLERYIRDVVEWHCYKGIALQVWAFRYGVATLLPPRNLCVFMPNELAFAVSGSGAVNGGQDMFWTKDHLTQAIIPDHGYDADSLPFQYFISVLTELSGPQRRQFLKFCTGTSVLPPGGFKMLSPPMRVVKKDAVKSSDASASPDNVLPSVMACSNYIKLPCYSSKEVLMDKLLFALREGQGAFTLS